MRNSEDYYYLCLLFIFVLQAKVVSVKDRQTSQHLVKHSLAQ